jgi:hypothetical protein
MPDLHVYLSDFQVSHIRHMGLHEVTAVLARLWHGISA